uniref:Uncharacterized protein n=1 Tax=Megaselia scalaris TaxID=36166 RepID=T1GLL7_MEGSC
MILKSKNVGITPKNQTDPNQNPYKLEKKMNAIHATETLKQPKSKKFSKAKQALSISRVEITTPKILLLEEKWLKHFLICGNN